MASPDLRKQKPAQNKKTITEEEIQEKVTLKKKQLEMKRKQSKLDHTSDIKLQKF